jgi:hypothetical protein
MNAPYPEHFALVHSLSDAALHTAANPAYLRLEKENITSCDRVDNLQCVTRRCNRIYHLLNFTHRTQLITALNAKPRRSNSNTHAAQGLPASKPPRISLRKSDYPNVKHWERRQNDVVQFAVIKVYETDSSDCDSDSRESGSITKHESGVLAFLEDENGKVIDHRERKLLYAELRGFWNDNIDANHPPANWSSAGATLRDKF